jgi:hypothetical protein
VSSCGCEVCVSQGRWYHANESTKMQIAAEHHRLLESLSSQPSNSQRHLLLPVHLANMPEHGGPDESSSPLRQRPVTLPEALCEAHEQREEARQGIDAPGPPTRPSTFDIPLRPQLARTAKVPELRRTSILPPSVLAEARKSAHTNNKRSAWRVEIQATNHLRDIKRRKQIAQKEAETLDRLEAQALETLRKLREFKGTTKKPIVIEDDLEEWELVIDPYDADA